MIFNIKELHVRPLLCVPCALSLDTFTLSPLLANSLSQHCFSLSLEPCKHFLFSFLLSIILSPPSILLTPGRQAVIHACNYGQTVLLLNRCEICIAQCVCVCSCVRPLSLLCSISSVLDTPQASCCLTRAIPFCF